jgi:DNA topoisomerase-1
VPMGLAPDELTAVKAEELLAEPSGDRELGTDPETGLMIVAKSGRYGPYVSEVLPEDSPKSAKPRTASLLSDMKPSTVTLEEALKLIRLPRVVGVDPSDGEEIRAQNGRYGPYLTKGTDSRSLESEEQIFSVTLEQALALFAQPKQRRGRGQAAAPLREVGTDPTSGKLIVVREGRFGAYVTDGETNATLRVVDDPMTVSVERASDLLAERKAKGPSKKTAKRATKKSTKKTTKKTTRAKASAGQSSGNN